jgi:hypothetical protein
LEPPLKKVSNHLKNVWYRTGYEEKERKASAEKKQKK